MINSDNKIQDMFLGLSLADALGVPVEFKSRIELKQNPVDTMLEYGTHYQPKGTWSDDSSLTFCLAESLISDGINLTDISKRFVNWKNSAYWTPHGEVFDIGIQTAKSISILFQILSEKREDDLKLLKYEANEYTNDNGSLMRILPLVFYIRNKDIKEQFDIIWNISSLTHGHIRSAIACLIYLKLAEFIIEGTTIRQAYINTKEVVGAFLNEGEISESEQQHFYRILKGDISKYSESEMSSSGYVLHTLEASLWCLLNTGEYLDSVFKAINLGEDTDTTATVVGGIAGLYYGIKDVPKEWLDSLARYDEIKDLSLRFKQSLK